MNALKPELMSAEERLTEICRILGVGLMRLHARKSSALSAGRGESSVDFGPQQSGHAGQQNRRMA